MNKYTDPCDPKGLIYEAYHIPNISAKDCRTIFFDWAISVSENRDATKDVNKLYQKYRRIYKDHPMTSVLGEGIKIYEKKPRRRPRLD